jgi:hypothetical protein
MLARVEPHAGLSEEYETLALNESLKLMNEFLKTEEGSNYVRDSVVWELGRALEKPDVCEASAELLVQALISTWAIFEVFTSSFLITILNNNPGQAAQVCAGVEYKRHFGKPLVDLDAISLHGFDLSKSMGTILFGQRRLDGLNAVKDMLGAALPFESVRSALNSKTLWILNQRRHLLVHKRGLIDAEYVRNTGDELPIGSRLRIRSTDVEGYLTAVRDTILAIVSAAPETKGKG